MDIFRTMIVAAPSVELAREIAASFGPGGTGMWTTPLSAPDPDPSTHFISTGYIPAEFAYLVPCQTWEQDEDGAWVLASSEPGDPVAVFTAATEAGVICTQAQVTAIFANADVTDQQPFVALGRLGLKLISEEP